jgi:putative lysine transport system substrate-binding protein
MLDSTDCTGHPTIDDAGDLKRTSSLSRRDFMRLSGLAVVSVGGMVVLSGCGPAAENSASSSAVNATSTSVTLGDGTTMRVGMEAAYAPYNWQVSEASDYTIPIENVSGAYADGYDVQFAKKIADALGMDATAVKMSFSGLIDALNNGQIDIICAGMSVTDERKQSIDFSDAYFVGGFGLLVQATSSYASATKLSDFSGAAVLGQKDTLLDTVIDDIPGVNHLTPVDSVPSQISRLLQGTCDAITYNTENKEGFLKANPTLVAVRFADGEGFAETIPDNAGIKKGQDAVLAQINDTIAAVSDDERQQLWQDCVDRQPV